MRPAPMYKIGSLKITFNKKKSYTITLGQRNDWGFSFKASIHANPNTNTLDFRYRDPDKKTNGCYAVALWIGKYDEESRRELREHLMDVDWKNDVIAFNQMERNALLRAMDFADSEVMVFTEEVSEES